MTRSMRDQVAGAVRAGRTLRLGQLPALVEAAAPVSGTGLHTTRCGDGQPGRARTLTPDRVVALADRDGCRCWHVPAALAGHGLLAALVELDDYHRGVHGPLTGIGHLGYIASLVDDETATASDPAVAATLQAVQAAVAGHAGQLVAADPSLPVRALAARTVGQGWSCWARRQSGTIAGHTALVGDLLDAAGERPHGWARAQLDVWRGTTPDVVIAEVACCLDRIDEVVAAHRARPRVVTAVEDPAQVTHRWTLRLLHDGGQVAGQRLYALPELATAWAAGRVRTLLPAPPDHPQVATAVVLQAAGGPTAAWEDAWTAAGQLTGRP